MTVKEAIDKRRSVRNFNESKISEANLKTILDAGLKCPRMGKMDFYVVENKELLKKISEAAFVNTNKFGVPRLCQRFSDPGRDMLHHAATLILVSGASFNPMTPLNAGAAIENMILMAESLGIDSCFAGTPANAFLFETEKEMRNLLHIPEGDVISAGVLLGYRENDEDVWPWGNDDVPQPEIFIFEE